MYRIHQIRLSVGESTASIPQKIIKKIGNKDLILTDMTIVRESIDARDKADIKLVYTVDFRAVTKQRPKQFVKLQLNPKIHLEMAPEKKYIEPVPGTEELRHRPIIVGFGPCGMFAALMLANRGYAPIVIERGNAVEQRVADVERFWNEGILNRESNVQFGEGGAGTFSDGKLTTGIKDYRIGKILNEFVACGADEDILYKQKPHIGTDVLQTVVSNIRNKIIAAGGDVLFGTKLVDYKVYKKHIASITVESIGGTGLPGTRFVSINGEQQSEADDNARVAKDHARRVEAAKVAAGNSAKTEAAHEVNENHGSLVREEILTENLIVAIGHSARDTFRMLFDKGINMTQKPFSIGVRIEHPQEMINKSQYGETRGLPPADYKLSYHCESGRGVYTFCMCPGGRVITASSQEGMVVTNGMSNRARNSGTANSGLLCDVKTTDFGSTHPLAGVEFQEKYERLAFENGGRSYKAPQTTWGEFKSEAEGRSAGGGEFKRFAENAALMAEAEGRSKATGAMAEAESHQAPPTDETQQTKNSATLVIDSLPDFVPEAFLEAMPHFGKTLKGFDRDDAVMTAVETRSSSPVRFQRGPDLQGTVRGFYPAGEGAGYAGGIMSAACDGIKIAEKIIEKYKPMEGKSC